MLNNPQSSRSAFAEKGAPWRSFVALLCALATAFLIGAMVTRTGIDEHRPPVSKIAPWPIFAAGLPVAASSLWAIFRCIAACRYRRSLDSVILSWVLPFCVTLSLWVIVLCLNIWLDRTGLSVEMTISDVFTVDRGHSEADRYVVVSLPQEIGGGSAVWLFQRWVDLRKYPIGSKAKIVWHKGYLDSPWCEYRDPRFPGYQIQLHQRERRGIAKSAVGQFSPGSTYKRMLDSWGIPVKEVLDLGELAPPVARP